MLLDGTDPRPDPAGHRRVKATRFDRGRDLIIVEGRIWGAGLTQTRSLRLVLDTGAGETIIVPDALDELGYSARQGEERTVVRSAVGREEGYMIRVARLACLGFQENEIGRASCRERVSLVV